MWNYRVVRKRHIYSDPKAKKESVDYTYAIHEAFYDKKNRLMVKPLSAHRHLKDSSRSYTLTTNNSINGKKLKILRIMRKKPNFRRLLVCERQRELSCGCLAMLAQFMPVHIKKEKWRKYGS